MPGSPMVGMASLITAWSLGVGTVLGLVGAEAFFVFVMTRLQIQPEERMLLSEFGVLYEQYYAKVHRGL